VFLRDRATGVTARASTDVNGESGDNNCDSFRAALSADGGLVAFSSRAGDLVAGDTNGWFDIFVRDAFTSCYADVDQDGYGAGAIAFHGLECGAGYASNADDCDDTRSDVHPLAPELCDGVDNDCDGQIDDGLVTSYCTAGTSVQGCTPTLQGLGSPSASASGGFTISASAAPGQRLGLFVYSAQPDEYPPALGSSSLVCLGAPLQRAGPPLSSGGTSGACDGAFSLDWNAWRAANPGALGSPFLAGQVFYAQAWYRDPGAVLNANLSDGLRFTLCP